ncbi:hypothetical protein NPX13_g2136 [Xylaria arbuscula]|uniref:Uncharacterized protein n=1 Tax=Xylaria arbuscula TaxID=114810 RepID=A0A9W8TQP5_9PEZI|nr:hypothetical protein NPX13_g2136 [Xylaria arbuscula]
MTNIYGGNYTPEAACELTTLQEGLLLSVQNNSTLCSQGFEGNSDLYGLGVRVGIYVQWIASFLANNLLPNSKGKLQGAWLLFALALCITTYVSSFRGACVFSIEIEILYWLFWGGFFCVFVSAPSSTRLGSSKQWATFDWTMAIQYTTISLMLYHSGWFLGYAAENVFSRMPCGTYHFFFAPAKDPGRIYNILATTISIPLVSVLLMSIISIQTMGFLFIAEVKAAIQSSATYRMFFPGPLRPDDSHSVDLEIAETPLTRTSHSLFGQFSRRLDLVSRDFATWYCGVRIYFGLPAQSRPGIRLITPMDIKDRKKYRIRCLIVGLLSIAVPIANVETILTWNQIVGVSSLIDVLWQLIQQEGRRRVYLRRRRLPESEMELELLEFTLTEALEHAFSQPDDGFLTNDGAFGSFLEPGSDRVDTVDNLP